ncbi:MAG: hypothetical protein JOZ69_03935 [Myxococcales bacterium]|nr:hypothetical protein [Myxococcales bacterium]
MRRRDLVGLLACAGACVIGAVRSGPADAKASYESPYGYERTWNAALRLVRVDNGWKVTEKDDASGYILFEYRSPENAKATPGSIELVRGPQPDSPVSVLAQIPQMPHYHEQVLVDALASKMRREYGDPPVRRKAPPPAPEGADGGPDA